MSEPAASISRRINEFDRFHTLKVSDREPVGESLYDEIDAFVRLLSIPNVIQFTGLGNHWHEADKSTARKTLHFILSHDLAYRTPEIPEADAGALADGFLNIFESDARFFTNGLFDDRGGWGGWGSVASATFETGIVVIDRSCIGILWCHDED